MATQEPTKYLGVTPPISTLGPNKREEDVTETLMQELKDQKTFESEDEARTREIVLGRIAGLVRKFVHRVCILRGLSEQAASRAGGKIFTFGSYRLGVHFPGSDIDTLVVVPKHVTREDFFEYFEPMLREFDGATNVAGVPLAYVPIITVTISGIDLDLSFARLALSAIPEDLDLRDDNLLKNLDERCVRSLGGSRVADEILHLVPNVPVFRDSLRCIKLWAQRRAISSNVNGFLGGIAWAILAARMCQLYPNANAGVIVSRFFIILRKWEWPNPVLLKSIEGGPLQVPVWNPKLYPADRGHRMPIITPAYPSMCSTHNVSLSTQTVIKQELERASEIVDQIIAGEKTWAELFAKHDFFHKYRYYLQVVASSQSPDTQLKWSGTVESKVRQLVMKLETVDGLALAHPFVKGFEQTLHLVGDDEIRAAAQGDVPPAAVGRPASETETRTLYITTFYIGLVVHPKQPNSVGPRRLDLSFPTQSFTKMVKMWEGYDEPSMGIIVRNIKSTALPDYVFDPGERAPRTLKRASTAANGNGNSGNGASAKAGARNCEPEPPSKKPRSILSQAPEIPVVTPAKEFLPPTPELPLPTQAPDFLSPTPELPPLSHTPEIPPRSPVATA